MVDVKTHFEVIAPQSYRPKDWMAMIETIDLGSTDQNWDKKGEWEPFKLFLEEWLSMWTIFSLNPLLTSHVKKYYFDNGELMNL